MATNLTAAKTTTDKPKRVPPTLTERVRQQLSTAALRQKLTVEDITSLESHLAKLKALIA
jgi:hypothetical protein